MSEEIKLNSVIKWAGGKKQLLNQLNNEIDKIEDIKNMTYIEPFVGAGALFLDLIEKRKFKKYIINDLNTKLINMYIQIRDNPHKLMTKIEKLKQEYLAIEDSELKKEYYYKIRKSFNEINLKGNLADIEKLNQSAYFIFLNKTGFNGLYRENKKGEFNVPIGSYKNPSIYIEKDILNLSKALNIKEDNKFIVEIKNTDYKDLLKNVNENVFIYFDPPYRPITVGGFNSYNRSEFNDKEQIELANFIKKSDVKGAKTMLSNSDPKNLDEKDEFFDDLYSDFNIKRVYARRSINSNGKARGNITELLITNFD